MMYKMPRRTLQVLTVVAVSLGALGITFYQVVAPFLFSQFRYASMSDPIRVVELFILERAVPWYPLGLLILVFAVFGRFFCGWACPFGFFQDILHVFQGMDLPQSIHNPLTNLKYGVLIAVMGAVYYTKTPFFDQINPFSTLVAAIPHMLLVGFTVNRWIIIRLTFFFLLLISFLFIHRFWCRYLCPVGAFAAIFNKVSPLHLQFFPSRCNQCKDCLDVCPTRVNIFEVARGRPTECILCGNCADVCQHSALELSFVEKEVTESYMPEESYKRSYPTPPTSYTTREYPPEKKETLSDVSMRKLRGVRARIIYFYEDPDVIPSFISHMEDVPNMQVWIIDMAESVNLVEHYHLTRPTLLINGRVYTGPLEEDAVVAYIAKDYFMLQRLSLVFDTAKCRPCKTRDCMNVCEKIDITFESRIEVHHLSELDCFACGECIVACKRGGVGLAYGEPKIDFEINLAHLESLQGKLLEVEPVTLKVFVERDSVHCNKVITMLAVISHLSRGKINWELIDAMEEPERAKINEITFLPTVMVGRFKTFGVPTEGSLVLLIRRNARWRTKP